MTGTAGHGMQRHPETSKKKAKKKQKSQEKQKKKTKIMASSHEKIGKAMGRG
jgi:hypothetical protein